MTVAASEPVHSVHQISRSVYTQPVHQISVHSASTPDQQISVHPASTPDHQISVHSASTPDQQISVHSASTPDQHISVHSASTPDQHISVHSASTPDQHIRPPSCHFSFLICSLQNFHDHTKLSGIRPDLKTHEDVGAKYMENDFPFRVERSFILLLVFNKLT